VGLYAELIDVNAYNQPGVEAGKRAAGRALELQRAAVEALRAAGEPLDPEAVAERIEAPGDAETIHHLLDHLAANGRGVKRKGNQFVAM
jgi:glucose-6-phosphate isomerase